MKSLGLRATVALTAAILVFGLTLAKGLFVGDVHEAVALKGKVPHLSGETPEIRRCLGAAARCGVGDGLKGHSARTSPFMKPSFPITAGDRMKG